MSTFKPGARPAHLLLICWIGVVCVAAGGGPAMAQPFNLTLSAQTFTHWISAFSQLFSAEGDPPPQQSGTCIDPNGKPKPCDPSKTIVPVGAHRESERPPRS